MQPELGEAGGGRSMPPTAQGGRKSAWGQQPGRGGRAGRGRGPSSHGRAAPSSPGAVRGSSAWVSSPAPATNNTWSSGPTPSEAGGGNRTASACDQTLPQMVSAKAPSTSERPSAQSAWARLPHTATRWPAAFPGSAPWKARPAVSPLTPSTPDLEDEFAALNVGAEDTTSSGPRIPSTVSVSTSGCEFSNEPQALEQLHQQQQVQDLSILQKYNPEQRDPSHTELRIASKQAWDADRLEEGCKLLNEGVGQKLAARRAGVLLSDLKNYWEQNYAHSESDSHSD